MVLCDVLQEPVETNLLVDGSLELVERIRFEHD